MIDISDPIAQLCEAFNLDVNDVIRIDLWPGKSYVTVTQLRRNANGIAYLDDGDVATTTTHEFNVKTYKATGA